MREAYVALNAGVLHRCGAVALMAASNAKSVTIPLQMHEQQRCLMLSCASVWPSAVNPVSVLGKKVNSDLYGMWTCRCKQPLREG